MAKTKTTKTEEELRKEGRKKEAGDYTSRQIQVLKGLEAVRLRPGMYIGSTSARGLHHLVYEVVDNSIDEAMAGYCTNIEVTIHADDSITVVGRRPRHPRRPPPGREGAGRRARAHPAARRRQVRQGDLQGQRRPARRGRLGGERPVGEAGGRGAPRRPRVDADFQRGLKTTSWRRARRRRRRGRRIRFKPDPEIFTELRSAGRRSSNRLRELAYLNRGTRITLRDEREEEPRDRGLPFEGGIVEYVEYLRGNKTALHDDVIYLEGSRTTSTSSSPCSTPTPTTRTRSPSSTTSTRTRAGPTSAASRRR